MNKVSRGDHYNIRDNVKENQLDPLCFKQGMMVRSTQRGMSLNCTPCAV